MDRRIGERQRWAWLAAGLSAVIAACLCGITWLWVLIGGILASAYYIYMDVRLSAGRIRLPKPLGALTLLWTVFAMAWSANLADRAFPMVDGFPVLGWTLLALTAWGSRKGAAACARCAGVLCLFLIGLYGVVAVFAAPDVRWENLRVTGEWTDVVWILGMFLLPASVWYVPCTVSKKRPAWEMALILPLSATALAAITAGVLSPALAAVHPAALYTLAQSVSLFGVVERIEPLLSAAMVMGVFCLLASMACACQNLGDRIRSCKWTGTAACILAAALMGVVGKIDPVVLAAGAVVFWMLVPLIVTAFDK